MNAIELLRTMEDQLKEVDVLAKQFDITDSDTPISPYIQEAIVHVYRRMRWGEKDELWTLTDDEREKVKRLP